MKLGPEVIDYEQLIEHALEMDSESVKLQFANTILKALKETKKEFESKATELEKSIEEKLNNEYIHEEKLLHEIIKLNQNLEKHGVKKEDFKKLAEQLVDNFPRCLYCKSESVPIPDGKGGHKCQECGNKKFQRVRKFRPEKEKWG